VRLTAGEPAPADSFRERRHRHGRPGQVRLVLLGLAFYYVVGSLVDVAAFAQGVVGLASLPSAVIRIALGIVCAWAAVARVESRAA
jgi:hypothetical protein